jgi:signal transduction histidine kinase
MDAIGSLAGGIAHDFNNILGVMLGYTEMALMSLKEDDGLKRRLQQVLKAGKRGKELVSQILSFSRPSPQERKPVHVSAVIKETLNMLRATLPTTIELDEAGGGPGHHPGRLHPDAPGDYQPVRQRRSRHAGQRGVLDISLKPVNLDAKAAAQFTAWPPGPTSA